MPVDPADVERVRKRLNQVVAMVRDAQTMPWPDQFGDVHEDNRFRLEKNLLPPEEGASLWAEFDFHTDRLHAVLNASQQS